ncbi:unnamed protein product [Parascedosporium putredinis]|uniref:Cupin type-1 domain-containing protein n=1 Tax=Parascedosporium putredinis TaxID=1442378 RepID=A0A9P1HA46_9PEZI|nr:unnamed protein product [Parascedosporium putredinis]CAI8004222.1 unnamed protein product [Parascedosporium putredinis]
MVRFINTLLLGAASALAFPNSHLVERDEPQAQFQDGQPIGHGKELLWLVRKTCGTNEYIDKQNPDNLGQQATDSGLVPNLKWRFSDSKSRNYPGGWLRTQVKQDLPESHDIAAAQQHLSKGAIREPHWHKNAEWGFVYAGSVLISIIDEEGATQLETLNYGDIWYFPKGTAHTVQGLEDENEFLLVFDNADFDSAGNTFNVADWLSRTPKDVLARNFGVDESVFDDIPKTTPNILKGTPSTRNVTAGAGGYATGDHSYIYRTLQHDPEPVPGNGGTFYKIDSTNFPVSTTIAATFVTLKPGGLRELHWHPNVEEWLYFHSGEARATVFTGNGNSRTFDFHAGDTAVFPDNSGHYIENTSETEDLVWIEIYNSDRVVDIALGEWLALTPADIVAQSLNVPIEFVEKLKREKQVLVA